jgi:hypothetical protein
MLYVATESRPRSDHGNLNLNLVKQLGRAVTQGEAPTH